MLFDLQHIHQNVSLATKVTIHKRTLTKIKKNKKITSEIDNKNKLLQQVFTPVTKALDYYKLRKKKKKSNRETQLSGLILRKEKEKRKKSFLILKKVSI